MRIMRMLKGLFFTISIIIFLIFLYAKYLDYRGLYYPIKDIELYPTSIGLAFEDVFLTIKDGLKINGWFIPKIEAKYTLLFCHGNAGNIGNRIDKINLLNQTGLNIFIFDYRGFGKSQGHPYESGFYSDAQVAYDYLLNSRNIHPEDIIVYGESLGSAVAIDLASKREIRALIIEGGFSCGRDMARKIYPFLPSFIFRNSFDSLSKIKAIAAAKLFIHSPDDEVVPVELAKKLYDYSKPPKNFVEISGDHNNAFLDSQEEYVSSIASFINNL